MTEIAFRPYEVAITRSRLEAQRIIVNDTPALVEVFKAYYEGLDREMVLAAVLDDVNGLLGVYEVSRGGTSESPIDPTNVFRPAILLGGSKVLLVHNHPTGDLRPSDGDVRSAKALFMLASLLDLEVSDNIVINAETGEHESVHAHPEFRRWLGKDLIRIAGIMAGGDLTQEQLAASEELEKAAANA